MTDSSEKYFIGETFVNIKTQNELFEQIKLSLQRKEKKIFFYLNSYSFYLVHHNEEFKTAFNSADFILIDGMSIVYFLKRYKYNNIEKVTFNHTFFKYLLSYFQEKKTRIYLLGSKEQNVIKAQENLIEKGLNICGVQHGYFNMKDSKKIIEEINKLTPDILLVGMGMPKSEKWIIENKRKFNDYNIITVGNLIDIFAGKASLAPTILFNSPFEWIYRLIREPCKLTPRYIRSNLFILDLLFRK